MSTQTAATQRWAREYETIYILRPDVDSAEAEKVAARVRDVMERMSGALTKVDTWGKRRLAYPIAKKTRGIYVYLRFVAYNDVVAELERNLRLAEPVIRFQTIVLRDMLRLDDVAIDPEEVEFETIEETEEEPELTLAQRLGLEERSRREDRDEAPAEAEAAAEGEGDEKAEEGAAPAEANADAAATEGADAAENTEEPAPSASSEESGDDAASSEEK